MDIIRRSSSPWASLLHTVKKPNGRWHPCGDYRSHNNATCTGSMHSTPRTWFFHPLMRDTDFLQDRPCSGVPPPNTIIRKWCPKDSNCHPIWALRVSLDAFWTKECSTIILKDGSQYTLEQVLRNLPASRCDQKCIQNDLHACRVRWNRNNFYSSVRARCDVRPNHFVCTSSRNACSSVYCEPALTADGYCLS